MDFDDTPAEAAYRAQVRRFLSEHLELAPRGSDRHADFGGSVEDRRAWQRTCYEGGLVGITWPTEHGGGGGTLMQQAIAGQELARIEAAPFIGLIGLGMAGPTIIAHGTEAQKQRFLRPLLRADEIWCQLFSEPAAGSDLAALQTRAQPDGEGGWRLRGQKVWTSGAHFSDWGIVVARTDPALPKHAGLSYFILDMHQPQVSVRPLRQMSGESSFNEVFLDGAVAGPEHLLGEVNGGWRVAITTLMNERLAIGGAGGALGAGVDDLVHHVARRLDRLPESRRALVRQELGRCYAEALAIRYSGYRRLSAVSRGRPPGPEAAAGKLAGTRLARDIADLGVRMLGDDALFAADGSGDGVWQYLQVMLPGLAIAGGTDEILKNIIGERVLGLPAEPRPDKGVPFAPPGRAGERPRGAAAAPAASGAGARR